MTPNYLPHIADSILSEQSTQTAASKTFVHDGISEELLQMSENSPQVSTLTDLRDFVQRRLCDQNELEVGAFRLTERVLEKGGAPCGIFFCLHGPRSVRLTAIWETLRNTVLFYSSTGERVQRIQLARVPSLPN